MIAGVDACGAGVSAHHAGSHGAAQHGAATTATTDWPCGGSAASVAGAGARVTGVSARQAGSRSAAQHGIASTATALGKMRIFARSLTLTRVKHHLGSQPGLSGGSCKASHYVANPSAAGHELTKLACLSRCRPGGNAGEHLDGLA